MGQSSSTQRDLPDTGYPTHHTPIERGSQPRYEDMNHRQTVEHNGDGGPPTGEMSAHDYDQGMLPDQPNERSESWRQYMRSARPMRSIDEDGLEYEVPPREVRNAAFARMTARRQSTMSRLGSRLLPNSVIRGLLNSQEETPAEGHAHRHGLINRTVPRTEAPHTTGRFSPFGSRGITRRRSTQSSYFPPRGETAGIPDGPTNAPYRDPADQIPEPTRATWRRSVRLNRMRHSISSPISHIFGQPHSGLPSQESAPTSDPSFDDREMDTRLDYIEPPHELDSVEPAIQPEDSLASLGAGPPNPNLMRRLPGLIRARSSRVLRREEQTPLSRVLQLAAAAIAAQLSGTPGPALPNIQALGNDGIDGSLENFIQSLQHATSGQAQPTPSGEGSSNVSNEAPAQPVNFLRVFRFANSETPAGPDIPGQNTSGANDRGATNDNMDVDEPGEGEGRTVTLVVVGVRSVPSANGGIGEQPAGPAPGLDALLGLPFLPPSVIPRPPGAPVDPAPAGDGQSRLQIPRQFFNHSGPQAPTGPPMFARPPPPTAARRMSEPHPPLFESPPGPHPPPSTPAEHAVSTGSSGTSTPSRRPSSASALPSELPAQIYGQPMQPTVEPTREPPAFNPAHQRRRSDSEFARHRALGSGSVRRNGMVEPDQPPPTGGRSWLIYVVGTNLSANHPALTTPSLFTDNPTYEDMILLSSLLGPAKPPVASQTDINSAGGLFRLVEYGGSLVAEALEGLRSLQLQDGERCLICLSDYEVAEEVRELNKCKHVFHKECIDQWLTTGRNSCPLCRGQGVHENAPDSAPGPTAPDSAPTAV